MATHQRKLDRALEDLKNKLIHMATIAETMIDHAIGALVHRDEEFAADVPRYEQDVNRLQIEIDETVQTLAATHQPVAGDLRLLLAATKINGELERIGDQAVNITEDVHPLVQQPELKPLIDIPRMAEIAGGMVRDSLQAFVRGDVLLAQSVIMTDDQVDALKNQVLRELLTYMMSRPEAVELALALILISRHLERIGDHATNIAEDVIYLVQGRDVRHPGTPKGKPAQDDQ